MRMKKKSVIRAGMSDEKFYTRDFPNVKVGQVKVSPHRGDYTVFIGLSDGTIAYQWCESKAVAQREAEYARGIVKKYGSDAPYWVEEGYKIWNPNVKSTSAMSRRRRSIRAGKAPFDIPNILESLKRDYESGEITLEEAAKELYDANWIPRMNDLEKTKRLLGIKSSVKCSSSRRSIKAASDSGVMIKTETAEGTYYLAKSATKKKTFWTESYDSANKFAKKDSAVSKLYSVLSRLEDNAFYDPDDMYDIESEADLKKAKFAKFYVTDLSGKTIEDISTEVKNHMLADDAFVSAVLDDFDDEDDVEASTRIRGRRSVKCSTRRRRSIKASSDDQDITITYNGQVVYTGSVYDMYGAIYRILFKDAAARVETANYLNEFGDPLIDNPERASASEVARVLTKLVQYNLDDFGDDLYEDIGAIEIFTDESVNAAKSVKCSTKRRRSIKASVGDEVYADDIKDIIRNAGIRVLDVKKSRIHNSDSFFSILLDNTNDFNAVVDAITDAGYGVTYDYPAVDGNWMYIMISDNREDDAFLYRVVYGYQSEVVPMDDETSDYQAVLDACIDMKEARGDKDLYTYDEIEEEGWNEDEYVTGGNHGLALYTGGNFMIEPIGRGKLSEYVGSSTRISAARDTTIDKDAVRELVLYITNDASLYPKVQSIVKNMQQKIKRGKYDAELAVKAWQYLADAGVAKYDREFGSGGGTKAMLNKATREQIARELRDEYEDMVNEGVEASEGLVTM